MFAATGPFGRHVIGSAELAASTLLIGATFLRLPALLAFGGLLALVIMSGAIFFHLFTLPGVEVQGDGGLLFGMAVGTWIPDLALVLLSQRLMRATLAQPHRHTGFAFA